jgi:cytochrome c biogenesis protein CcmG/thiol:disulfide interchange protein DsbE
MTRIATVFLLALLPLLFGCGDEEKQLVNGQPAPAFTLNRLAGGTLQFPGDLGGRVVAIRFWADWCPFCEGEMRLLEPIFREYRERGLTILAVNVRQDRDTAARFVGPLDISYDTLLDEVGEVARAYGVIGLPTTFFVDGNGLLRTRILGESTPETFEKIVQELMQ